MKESIKQEFIYRLKHGGYSKGTELLYYETTRGTVKHCALGVLADMYVYETSCRQGKFVEVKLTEYDPDSDAIQVNAAWEIRGSCNALDRKIKDWAGLSDVAHDKIIQINDESGIRSFSKVIEYVKQL